MDKSGFRKKAAEARNMLFSSADEKMIHDESVFKSLLDSGLLENKSQILCYVSVRSEAGTEMIIRHCLDSGIRVGVPKCGKSGKMDFYYINDPSELTCSYYGIPEPQENSENLVTDFTDTLCIVPGLAFDRNGRRMGYGGGFYDRFLSGHSGIKTAGICYHSLLSEAVPSESHDISVDYILTEKGIIEVNGE